jgi:hypothetical protein
VPDGSRGAFFVTVIAEKSNYTKARQKMHPFRHRKLRSHNVSYTLQGILVFLLVLPFSL